MKLMIGIPGFAGIVPSCQENIAGMIFRLGRDTDYEVAFKVVVKKEQFRARNAIVNDAIAGGFDYLLMLDDDMVVPHDLPLRLLAHDKDVVGALYYQRGGMFKPVIMSEGKPDSYGEINFAFWSHYDERLTQNRGLYQTDVIGGGCMLFKTEVFKKIPAPYFQWEEQLGTDIAICTKLRQAGYEIWVDTSIELGHVGEPQMITSRTIDARAQVTAEAAEMLGKDLEAFYKMPMSWVKDQMEQATSKALRKGHWGDRSNEWEDVRAYYQENADWHVFNLAGFNIWSDDPCRRWMLNEGIQLLNRAPGGRGYLLDYGPGVGIIDIPIAEQHGVFAVEVRDAATLSFLQFRQNRHWGEGKNLVIWETDTPYPTYPIPRLVDGAACISVLNHLTHPLETMKWISEQLKPGAFFVCDWALHSDHDDGEEPQHLDAYDLTQFVPYMHELGFVSSPEYQWLFFYHPRGK